MKRIILHIGSPKTGTSIIQSHLAQNRRPLRDMGYLYPITISADKTLYRTFESHHLLTYAIADWAPFNRYSPSLFFEMAEKCARDNNLHTLLLSAENTFWLPRQIVGKDLPDEKTFWDEKRTYVENIHRYLKDYDTDVVVYLRRQDRWIESWFNQQVKNGNALLQEMSNFIEHHRWLLDYERLLGIWESVFGADKIIVRVYENESLCDGLFQDFCDTVGIDEPEKLLLRNKPRYNAQMSRDALAFMNICNGLPMSPDQKWWLRMMVRKVTNQFESQLVFHSQSLLSPQERTDLVERYADANSRIAKKYLDRQDGRLFKEPAPDPNAPWEPYPGLAPEKVLEILMPFILELQKRQTESSGALFSASALLRQIPRVLGDLLPGPASALYRYRDKKYWDAHIWDRQ